MPLNGSDITLHLCLHLICADEYTVIETIQCASQSLVNIV